MRFASLLSFASASASALACAFAAAPVALATTLALGACGTSSSSSSKPPETAAPLEIKPMPSSAPVASGPSSPKAEPPPVPKGKCIASSATPAPGILAPPLAASTLEGGRTGVNNQRVTVVYYWATWCAPCKAAFPRLEKLWEKNAGRGVDVWAVSVDDDKVDVAPFVKSLQVRFPIAWDEGHTVASCWKVSTMPTTYVVDREGVLRFIHEGAQDPDQDAATLQQEIDSLL